MQCNGVKEKIRDQLRADGFFSFFLCVFFVFGLFFFLFFVFFFGATVSGDGRLRWFVRVFTRPGRRIGLRRIGLLAAAGVGLSPEAKNSKIRQKFAIVLRGTSRPRRCYPRWSEPSRETRSRPIRPVRHRSNPIRPDAEATELVLIKFKKNKPMKSWRRLDDLEANEA